MKKVNMQRKNKMAATAISIIATAMLMSAFCIQSGSEDNPPKTGKPTIAFAHLDPQPDSVVVAILGEKVSKIVFGSKRATLSHLNPGNPPADGDVTIGGVKVNNQLGTLSKNDLATIQFLLSDSAFFNNSPVTVTSPFAPNYALTFIQGKQRVDLIFSLVSFQMGIVENGKLTKVVHYNNARQTTRFFRLVSQNEFYDRIIENQ